MNRILIALTMIVSLLVGVASAYLYLDSRSAEINNVVQESEEGNELAHLNKVGKAFYLILNSYVEEVGEEKLVEGAIKGMLSTLEDPYSVYMDQEKMKQFDETLQSSFQGIGAEVSMVNGKMLIVAPFKGSPAEKAGLKPNDHILKIDGVDINGLDLVEATMKIRGEKGTVVQLEIDRVGLRKPLKIAVERDEIPQITVYGKMMKHNGKRIGYVEITSFSEETATEFHNQLRKLEKKNMDGLLIDVRGNPGGFLTSVEEILKEFVTKEKPMYQIEKRNGEKIRYLSNLEKKKPYPVAVLIDNGSASASEILAGALQEGNHYTLIGSKSFGKGTVQQPVPMGDGSNIKLTVFKWLTPDGNWIHEKGIQPDIEVSQSPMFQTHPLQLEEVLKIDMNNEQVQNAQQILEGLGFAPGRVDGYYDNGTEKAVKAFQNHHRLTVNGRIDQVTGSAMEEAIRTELKKEKNDLQLQTALRYMAK